MKNHPSVEIAELKRQLTKVIRSHRVLEEIHNKVCEEYTLIVESAAVLIMLSNEKNSFDPLQSIVISDENRKLTWDLTHLRVNTTVIVHKDDKPNEMMLSPVEWTTKDAKRLEAIKKKARKPKLLGPTGLPMN